MLKSSGLGAGFRRLELKASGSGLVIQFGDVRDLDLDAEAEVKVCWDVGS